jgi:4-alpha-glucanotransferase
MPPCLVVRLENGSVLVPLPIKENDVVNWLLVLESGSRRTGSASIDRDPLLGPVVALTDVPLGYHRLEIEGCIGATSLIVTPGRCWIPEYLETGGKLWGVSLQLYLLRSKRNWGIGDFADLATLSEWLSAQGCNIIGLNPLHQMFLDDPEQASPYSPTDRQFLNVLNIDVESVPDFVQSAEARQLMKSSDFRNALHRCRTAESVEYSLISELKVKALRSAYASFSSRATDERRAKFDAFVAEAGEPLRRSSLFQAMQTYFAGKQGYSAVSTTWPEAFRTANSPEAADFASTHSAELGFLNWLQWIADEQLKSAADCASAGGMQIGFYRDMAVGCDRNGAELWSDPDAFLKGAQVGAPPDLLNPAGQNWGLPPFNPVSLVDRAYAPFINLIRANMRHAGALRIDHVMGLQRLYCIPEGSKDGAYVSYPVDDLIGILALESCRHRCLVVGEDLGTVPEGFREKMTAANILSYRVTFFEQANDGSFIPADQYPSLAVAVAGSHDLPTLKSWLCGSDIELKHSLGLYPSEQESQSQRQNRAAQKQQLSQALKLHGDDDWRALINAMHAFLAQTNSMVALAQLDDLIEESHPVNVPGTSTEHANWRRRYSVELEQLIHVGTVQEGLASFRNIRGTESKSKGGHQ